MNMMNLHGSGGLPPDKRSLDQAVKPKPAASHAFVRRDRWLCLAERVLGGWAPTLRVALLILVVGVCVLGVTAATFGVLGVAAGLAAFIAGLRLIPHGELKPRDS
jgi:hypothetical protein